GGKNAAQRIRYPETDRHEGENCLVEVAGALVERRDAGHSRGRQGVLQELFEVKEEECLVFSVVQFWNADRPAQRETVIVPAQGILEVSALTVVRERRGRVQKLVVEIVVGCSVELVGAGLHRVIEVTAAHLPVL